MSTIAIIGAGFSGTLLSLHLLRRCPPATRLVLIERNSQFGRGLAYSTGNPSHILNVPAGRMSAFADKPDDFVEWLATQPEGAAIGPRGFAPRRLFGAYIRALLNQEIKRSGRTRLELVRGNVAALDRTREPLLLTLESGETLEADIAVLANGNFPPEPVPVANAGFYDTAYYRGDPWAADAIAGLDKHAPVVLLGTGLTMVDMTISLLDQQHKGPIIALSRRGLTPRRHAAVAPPELAPAPMPISVAEMMRHLRQRARQAVAQGSGWQPVIDELRPHTIDLWQAMPMEQRRRFLRHGRAWWDVHRHRMAAEVADRIDAARQSGQLRVIAGRVRDYDIRNGSVSVIYRPRRQDAAAAIEATRVINCAGLGADYDRIAEPLIRSLLQLGTIRPDAMRLGLDVTGNCALINRDGAISRRLYAVGPLTKGVFWEMVAVPDLRRQTARVAEHLAGLVK